MPYNPEAKRNNNYLRNYGITTEQYEAMLVLQNGVCAICEQGPTGRRLCVDHDHNTGQIRALLCNYCNTALHIVEDQELMQRLQEYLERA